MMRRGWVVLMLLWVLLAMLGCSISGACLRPNDTECERAAAPAMTAVREVPTVRVLMTAQAEGR